MSCGYSGLFAPPVPDRGGGSLPRAPRCLPRALRAPPHQLSAKNIMPGQKRGFHDAEHFLGKCGGGARGARGPAPVRTDRPPTPAPSPPGPRPSGIEDGSGYRTPGIERTPGSADRHQGRQTATTPNSSELDGPQLRGSTPAPGIDTSAGDRHQRRGSRMGAATAHRASSARLGAQTGTKAARQPPRLIHLN